MCAHLPADMVMNFSPEAGACWYSDGGCRITGGEGGGVRADGPGVVELEKGLARSPSGDVGYRSKPCPSPPISC